MLVNVRMAPRKLFIVCDDAGFASVDRGVLALAEATGKPLCAEYLIAQPGATDRAKAMLSHPLMSVGLHFELSRVPDAERVALSQTLQEQGTTLGEQPDIRAMATEDAVHQLATFRRALGRDPLHVSTHGDFNVDSNGNVLPWWTALMDDIFSGAVPAMQWARPVLRHNKYSWNLAVTKHTALTPDEFEAELAKHASGVVEFVVHPALPYPEDADIDMLFDARMRVADFEAAVAIVDSGCIERAGFEVVSAASVAGG